MSTRWLARAILKAGVRMASPEAREWGQAMLRELDFVPGDWASLWWALGSVGALFQAPHAPLQTAEDVLCRAKALRAGGWGIRELHLRIRQLDAGDG